MPEANLRQGPGTNHEKGWQVFKYMPLQKIGQKGDWYQMKDVDGDEHWIYSKLVTNDIRCAVVKVKSANVRTGPGTNHKSLFAEPVEEHYSLKVIETRRDWLKVQDAALKHGWVHEPLLWVQ